MLFLSSWLSPFARYFQVYTWNYNLTQLISRFTCLYLKESKCSKWQDGNFTNNLTLLILFILFHDCWNKHMCWMYGCTFEINVITASFCLTFTTCHLQGVKQTLPYVKISNLLSSKLSPLFLVIVQLDAQILFNVFIYL